MPAENIEPPDMNISLTPQQGCETDVITEAHDRMGEPRYVVRFNEETIPPVVHQLGQAPSLLAITGRPSNMDSIAAKPLAFISQRKHYRPLLESAPRAAAVSTALSQPRQAHRPTRPSCK